MKVHIVSPSKCIEPDLISEAVDLLEEKGFRLQVSDHAASAMNYFSGSLDERKNDFQNALNSDADVIWTSRGGYGMIQYIDQLNFNSLAKNHKWIIGFSDVTVAHLRLNQLGIPSIHGTVPLNFNNVTPESLHSIFNVLEGRPNNYIFPNTPENNYGTIKAEIVGGNLAIIYSMLGSKMLPEFKGKILFIEDVGEALYAIDRMMNALRLNGILDEIAGLVVGGFTSVGDSIPNYGETVEEIISKYLLHRKIPICFNFPAGHQRDNRAIILGATAELTVQPEGVSFHQQV